MEDTMRLQTPDPGQSDQQPDDLQTSVAELLEQIAKRDQRIARDQARLLYTQAQLAEKEARLSEITNSRAWKITRPLRWVRSLLAARGGARASMLRRGWELIVSSLRSTRRS